MHDRVGNGPRRLATSALLAAALLALVPPLPVGGTADPPGPATTGVPPGTVLRPSGPLVVTQNGAVIDGLDVDGCIEILADDVVVRNTRIRCSRQPGEDRTHAIDTSGDRTLIEDVEISGGGDPWTMGVLGSVVTVRRVNIHGVGDGLKANSFSLYEGNYIHDLADGEDQHNDGIQMSGGRDTVIRGNRILHRPEQTSAILLKADRDTIHNVTIEDNWLEGGNYTLYVIGKGPPAHRGGSVTPHETTDVVVRNNRFSRSFNHGILLSRNAPGLVWEGNVWDDTGGSVGPIGGDGIAPVAIAPPEQTPEAPAPAAAPTVQAPRSTTAAGAAASPGRTAGPTTPAPPAASAPGGADDGSRQQAKSRTREPSAGAAAGITDPEASPARVIPRRGAAIVATLLVAVAAILTLREAWTARHPPTRR